MVLRLACCRFGVWFFFKQKTAYEMRISDWSSDVCSSDLCRLTHKRIVGGVSHTELTAEQVSPARPNGPSVATTVTGVDALDSAALKAAASIASRPSAISFCSVPLACTLTSLLGGTADRIDRSFAPFLVSMNRQLSVGYGRKEGKGGG